MNLLVARLRHSGIRVASDAKVITGRVSRRAYY